jgi:hypothetical protein
MKIPNRRYCGFCSQIATFILTVTGLLSNAREKDRSFPPESPSAAHMGRCPAHPIAASPASNVATGSLKIAASGK